MLHRLSEVADYGNHDSARGRLNDPPEHPQIELQPDIEEIQLPRDIKLLEATARMSGQSIGYCSAKLIKRDNFRTTFWSTMTDPSTVATHTSKLLPKTTESPYAGRLALDLFDRFGRLDREYCQHAVRKGSGVWGPELDLGDILVFENLEIDRHWMRQGLGMRLINRVLRLARAESSLLWAFVHIDLAIAHTDSSSVDSLSEGLWCSLGFRQVGNTKWLAFADEPGHLARVSDGEYWGPENVHASLKVSPEAYRVFGVINDSSLGLVDCIRAINRAFPVVADDPGWLQVDERGYTVLHASALALNSSAVKHILMRCPALKEARNPDGHTPLEALCHMLELERTGRQQGIFFYVLSDQFRGHHPAAVACLAVFNGEDTTDFDINFDEVQLRGQLTSSPSLSLSENDERKLRYKYGCTCGQCLHGVISPRTIRQLRIQARHHYKMLVKTINLLHGILWVEQLEHAHERFALTMRALERDQDLRWALIEIFVWFDDCLGYGRVPTPQVLRDGLWRYDPMGFEEIEWPLRMNMVSVAVTEIFHKAARERVPLGIETMFSVEPRRCRNDHEYGFVQGMCGFLKKEMSLGRSRKR